MSSVCVGGGGGASTARGDPGCVGGSSGIGGDAVHPAASRRSNFSVPASRVTCRPLVPWPRWPVWRVHVFRRLRLLAAQFASLLESLANGAFSTSATALGDERRTRVSPISTNEFGATGSPETGHVVLPRSTTDWRSNFVSVIWELARGGDAGLAADFEAVALQGHRDGFLADWFTRDGAYLVAYDLHRRIRGLGRGRNVGQDLLEAGFAANVEVALVSTNSGIDTFLPMIGRRRSSGTSVLFDPRSRGRRRLGRFWKG